MLTSLNKHIFLGYAYKFLGIGISFYLYPLTISYLEVTYYGVWVTMFSILMWINFFDFGIGLGFRNKLAEAIARNDSSSDIKQLISTSYFIIAVLAICFAIIIFISSIFINFASIFNTNVISENNLKNMIRIASSFVILNFILSLINPIFYAYQKASIPGLISLLQNLLLFIFVYYLTLVSTNNIYYLLLAQGFSTTIVNICATVYFFSKNQQIIFNPKDVILKKFKELFNLSGEFFILQITCLMIFATPNFLITQLLGPEHVRPYDIVFKVFGAITLICTIYLTPFWSAYTVAWNNNNIEWIIKTIKRQVFFGMTLISIVTVTLMLNFEKISFWWLKIDIQYPEYLIIFMSVYIIIFCWNNIFAYFLNGTSNIRLQINLSFLAILTNILLAIYFVKYQNLGTAGIVLAMICALLWGSVITSIQTYLLIKNKKVKKVEVEASLKEFLDE